MAILNIITNNEAVVLFFEQYKNSDMPEVMYVDATVTRVFQTAKDEVKKGARLLLNPLSGGDTKFENPFKTLLISPQDESGVIHFASMSLIESSAHAYNKAAKNRFRAYTDENITEFKKMDLEITLSGMQEVLRSML